LEPTNQFAFQLNSNQITSLERLIHDLCALVSLESWKDSRC
jgi:hypothetical protein